MSGLTVAIALSSQLFMGSGWSNEFFDFLQQGEPLATAGRVIQLNELASQIASQPDGPVYSQLFVACMQIVRKKPAEAAKALDAAIPPTQKMEELPVRLQLAFGETFRRCQRTVEAIAIADRVGKSSVGIDRALAARLMSDVFADRLRWPEALEWITVAIKTAEHVQYSDPKDDFTKRLRQRKTEIEQLIDLGIHGLGFRLYRIGNEQRLAGRYPGAVATYDRLLTLHKRNADKPMVHLASLDDPRMEDLPIHDIYAAASEVYLGECLMRIGRFRDAREALESVSKDALHPYQGEALKLLGDIALDESGDIKAAEVKFTSAINVYARADAESRALDRFRVPELSRAKTKPPQAMRSYASWGSLEWYRPEPNQVINADTCQWYTSYQTMDAQIKRSMCYFLLGKTDDAVRDLAIITIVDSHDRSLTESSMPSNYLRLRDGYRAGRLYATSQEMMHFSGKALVQLVKAEVLFETEQWGAAAALYGDIAKNYGPHLSNAAKAYLDYAQASAFVFAGSPKKATGFVHGFLGDKPVYANTVTYWRSLFLLANLDPANEDTFLRKGASACPDQSLRLDFVLRLGQLAYTRNDDEAAVAYFTLLAKTAPATDYRRKSASNYLTRIQSRSSDQR